MPLRTRSACCPWALTKTLILLHALIVDCPCADPDMLQVGNLQGSLAAAESRTHYGAWCIVSSPLILGVDLRNDTTMASIWPYISNKEAIQVNQQWAGDPGRFLNLSSSSSSSAPSSSSSSSSVVAAVEVWAKLQPGGAVALLAFNTDAVTHSAPMSVDLSAVWPAGVTPPAGWCSSSKGEGKGKGKACSVRDIWKQEDSGQISAGGAWQLQTLAPHDSAFVLISPPAVH